MAKVITFFNFKGGVGKTALAVLFADYLAYRTCKKVLAVDMDNPIYNFGDRRNKDLEIFKDVNSALYKLAYKTTPYDVCNIKGNYDYNIEQREKIRKAIEAAKEEYDYIVLDFPGQYTANGSTKYLLHKGMVDLLVIPVNSGKQSQNSAVELIRDTHSIEFCRESGYNAGQPTLMLWNKLSAADRKGTLSFVDENLLAEYGIEFTRQGINDMDSLSDKKDPATDRLIFNTLCYPQANVQRICGYLEKVFVEIKLRADGKWTPQIQEQLYPSIEKK